MEGGRLWELLMVTNSTVDLYVNIEFFFIGEDCVCTLYMYMYKSTTISCYMYAMYYSELAQEVSSFI